MGGEFTNESLDMLNYLYFLYIPNISLCDNSDQSLNINLVHLPLPQLVAYIFGIPSSTSSSPYDSHARSSASDHLNQSSHLVMHAITSCHIERLKISVHFCRNALAVVFAVRVRVGTRGLWCSNEFTLGICRCSCVFTRRETRQKSSGEDDCRSVPVFMGFLNFKMERICALVFFNEPLLPVHLSRPVPHRWYSVDLSKCQSKHGAPGVIALFSSSNIVKDIVQLSFTPLR